MIDRMGFKGMISLYIGSGKGKTTAAIGQAVRAHGAGFRVLFVQFLKGRHTSEVKSLERLGIEVCRCEGVEKFFSFMEIDEKQSCAAAVLGCFERAVIASTSGEYQLIILDEILDAVKLNILTDSEIATFLKNRSENCEIVLTGRSAGSQVSSIADYITDMRKVRHPFDNGVQAREGVEY